LSYISNTAADRQEMLAAIGIDTFDELLAPVPDNVRLHSDLNLPLALDEPALVRHLTELANRNLNLQSTLSFLGAGIYDHFRPAVVAALASRGEFATSYTPYQPEVSQGMLQAIYEYQTLICALTQMDLANASMYDAASGIAEAALMAISVSGRPEVVVMGSVHPHYRQVLATYLASTGYQLREVSTPATGMGLDELRRTVGPQTACVVAQHPNFYGCLEEPQALVAIAHGAGALAILSVDPISLGLLKPPGAYGVDIVVGEGQALGNPMGFGGPLLGFFACNKRFVRSFPGRIVGATVDQQGRRGYTMTLRTREQDIRREKATSNICTNQALLALCATIYLCELGKTGLRQVADLCLQKAHYACDRLSTLPGVQPAFPGVPFFKEFVLRLPVAPESLCERLLARGILAGLPLGSYDARLHDALLVCVTESKTRADIDGFVSEFEHILEEN